LLVNGIRSVVGCTVLALAALTLGACSSDSGKTVNVTAADFSLKPDVTSVPAGTVKFKVKNSGGFGHEMVVVKIADAKDLPTKPDGEVDETKIPKAKQLGEVEDVLPGQTKTVKLDLDAGKYVLFCNRKDGTKAVHFKKGMYVDFTVTPAK
jgi:uncharacterized cupredoxin-like copper-binding protein